MGYTRRPQARQSAQTSMPRRAWGVTDLALTRSCYRSMAQKASRAQSKHDVRRPLGAFEACRASRELAQTQTLGRHVDVNQG